MSAGDEAVPVAALDRDNPWPGLLSFRETDEGYFQGRQTETEELLRLVLRERLTVLFGLSGLGKSSLLQAGLFPRLRRKNVFPVYIRLDFSAERPDLTAQVIATIAREASTRQIEAPAAKHGETLWEYFHRDGNNFWNARNRPVTPLLVYDQFEETFTLGRLDSNRSAATDAFLVQLADMAECRPSAALKAGVDMHPEEAKRFNFERHYYKILLSIREDFLPDLETLRASMPTLALNRTRLERMNGEAALLVVSQAQHLIDPEVGEQVVRFVAAAKDGRPLENLEIEPALLSVVCRELNIRRQNKREDKISADLLKGSQEQVLADFYERSTSDLPLQARSFVEDKLLTVSGYRDSVALENALSTPGVSSKDIETLVERRLIRREDRGGTQRLELTHDLLAGVVCDSRDSRRQRETAERERAALLQTQAKLRLSRLLVAIFAVLALVAVGTAAWGFWERARAKALEAKALANEQAALVANQQLKLAQAAQNQKIIEATTSKDPSQALAQLAQTASAKLIYLQYVDTDQVPLAKLIQNNLTSKGYFVPGIEKVAANFSPSRNQVRYFHAEDQAEAGKIADLLKQWVAGDVNTQLTFNPKNVVPQGQFEFWLASATRAAAPQISMLPPFEEEPAQAVTKKAQEVLAKLVQNSYQGDIVLRLGNQFFNTDFALGPERTAWDAERGRYNARVGYWLCQKIVRKCWQAPNASGPLRYWNEDGHATGSPEDWELFNFELADPDQGTVVIKNTWGKYVRYSGSTFVCDAARQDASVFTPELP